MAEERLLTTGEIAAMLSVSRQTVSRSLRQTSCDRVSDAETCHRLDLVLSVNQPPGGACDLFDTDRP